MKQLNTVPTAHTCMRPLSRQQLHKSTKHLLPQQPRKMSYLFPRFAYAPVRCGAVRHEFAPLLSLFDDTARELQHISRGARQTRKTFNPRFDVKEDKDSYVLEGEVPGFQEADLSIEWNDNTLAVRGQHESVTESGKKPEALESTPEQAKIDNTAASETNSVKSHQPTVEDEEPAAAETSAAHETTNDVAQSSQADVSTKNQQAQPEVQHWVSERRSGQFLRQFRFPNNAVDHDAIKASLQSGILKIVVPKAEAPASRRINIE